VARRLARFGTRWIPWGLAITSLGESVPAMKQAIADAGGDPTGLEVQGAAVLVKGAGGGIDIDASLAPVAAQVAAGATDIRFAGSLPEDPRRAAEELSRLVRGFRDVTQASV
jgi:alkanesulfonate monooxygenase SsuD/methylene tetrahydromethanopterin reductase-like flavin-dependent oxidoreductase (luciferase family)